MTGKITEAELREQVKILAGKFLQRTATQIPQLRTQIECLAATGDVGALRIVQELAHKIHGSGAMFGFESISEVAGELQQLSVRGDEPDSATLMALAAQMRVVLNRLADSLNAASQGP
jgi:HPt (histidine-containing phosphotransfer) domain-containing protein